MNKITFPLRPQMQGSTVADLQDALKVCVDRSALLANNEGARRKLLAALISERDAQSYGRTTTRLVSTFQRERQLEGRDEVDEPTANALNSLLIEWGLLDRPTEPTAAEYRVDGKVFSRVSAGVGSLRVQVIDKAVGGDGQLAEATTDDRGAYEARFSDSDVQRRGKTQPDLQARVFTDNTLLGASDVRYNASQNETLNVLVEDNVASALKSEHEVLTNVLANEFKGRLRDLKETEEQQDITYLANKTGWDARAVAMAALADQFSARTADGTENPAIAPAFFYALFRSGLPTNEDMLYHADARTLEGVWQSAAEQGVIPKASADQIGNLVGRFQALSAQKLLTGPAPIGPSSIREMLTISRLDEAQQTKFAQLYAANRSDMPTFWKAIGDSFGEDTANRLQVDGKLGFLTINNAPLMRKVHAAVGDNGVSDPLQLAQDGYHRAERWNQLLTADVPIPKEIPGETPEIKRANYADYLAAQVRLSYPTAAVAQMVKSGTTPIGGAVRTQVHDFLMQHQTQFDIGSQAVEQYVRRNNLDVSADVITEVTRIQRTYQLTPSDDAMNAMLKRGVDSAYKVVSYGRDVFVRAFEADLGGKANAELVYAKAQEVHNAVLNIAVSYLIAKSAVPIGGHSEPHFIDPSPKEIPENAGDVIAYPTIASLVGEMDYCECDHCRSILSPAAYLVNLLQFLGPDEKVWKDAMTHWKQEYKGIQYPFTTQDELNNAGNPSPTDTEVMPLDVLLSRRPDIEYLPLTCENTNTPIPYIDLVNETLEFYVSNKFSLLNYKGNSTDSNVAPEELLASPQFVTTEAYEILKKAAFPTPLPFHKDLEELRRYFQKFGTTLPEAMEALCQNDKDLDPPTPVEYSWRDILMEELQLSRLEYELLTAGNTTISLQQFYGYPSSTFVADTIKDEELSGAKTFSLRVGVSYEELVDILKTRFINPDATLIPKLERLRVPFAKLKQLHESTKTDEEWLKELPQPLPDASHYDGNIEKWVKDKANYAKFMHIITLTVLSDAVDPCSFENLVFRYSDPDQLQKPIQPFEFVRLIRFIRLWRKLGWTIEESDKAITALYPPKEIPDVPDDTNNDANRSRLDAGFKTLLPHLGVLKRLMRTLKLNRKKDLLPLLGCFAAIDTHGNSSLYRRMFLNLPIAEQSDQFADDGYGEFLETVHVAYKHENPSLQQSILSAAKGKLGYDNTPNKESLSYTGILDTTTRDLIKSAGLSQNFNNAVDALYTEQRLHTHSESLRSAFNLTAEEYDTIVNDLKYDPTTPLGILNISAIYRRGWLARKLKVSVRELLLLMQLTGLNPFNPPDPPDAPHPPIERLVSLVERLRALSLKPEQALYLIWNQDISGKSTPEETQITEFTRALRAGMNAVEMEFSVVTDPDGQVSRSRMVQVYGIEATDFFFGLTGNTLITEVDYDHDKDTLDQPIVDAARGHIAYDDFRKRLSFSGVLTEKQMNKILQESSPVTDAFKTAFKSLYSENHKVVGPFFARYPELQPLHDAFVFFGDLKTDVSYTQSADTLAADIVKASEGRLAYDSKNHRLIYKGVLSDEVRKAIETAAGAGAADFKKAVGDLYTADKGDVNEFFSDHPDLNKVKDAYLAANDSPQMRYSVLLANFLPELIRRRKRQQCLQALSTATNADLIFTSTLLNSYVDQEGVLYTPGGTDLPHISKEDADAGTRWVLHSGAAEVSPALNDFMQTETVGLSATFAYDNTVLAEVDASLNYSPGGKSLPFNPAGTISAVWSGFLEAPENGFYNFGVETDNAATLSLTLGGKVVLLAEDGKPNANPKKWTNKVALELRAGKLYPIELKVDTLKDRMTLRWQTRGRGWELISPANLYASSVVEQLRTTYVRFAKAISLTTNLKLNAAESAHVVTRKPYWIKDQSWLNSLSIIGNPDTDTSTKLLPVFSALLDFARIKAALAPDPTDERLLAVLKDPSVKTASGKSLLLDELTRWQAESRKALMIRFGKTKEGQPMEEDIDKLKDLDTFSRVYDAYVLVKKVVITASALISAVNNEPSSKAVDAFKKALRARYDPSDWLQVIKPIHDELRGLQRDALVAHILHQMRLNKTTSHIDTADKLFEYFLMDVQMDPCMQTSRIRHAIASVQLFVERCLMCLEPRVGVGPTIIDPQQWEVKKRYRLHEANLKVFLWPENWMVPELRDDQSPFFKEAMSELLQSDITTERAEAAFLNYLGKLEEVAKLEPCGIHYVEADPGHSNDISHVVARTTGAKRKYFYRKRESTGWTAWEEIKLDIEDNPVIPVVWKDRLFLFWLRLLKDAPLGGTLPAKKAVEIDASKDIGEDAKRIDVRAILCWSEYYGGKWQPPKTSDVDKPISPDTTPPEMAYNRSSLGFRTQLASQSSILLVSPRYNCYFKVFNSHGQPEPVQQVLGNVVPRRHIPDYSTKALNVTYYLSSSSSITRHVLYNKIDGVATQPQHDFLINPLQALLHAPFLYQDSRHVFYVTPKIEKATKLPDHPDYGVQRSIKPDAIHPIIYYEQPGKVSPLPGPDPRKLGLSRLSQIQDITQNIIKVIGSNSLMTFDGKTIGVNGSVSLEALTQ